MELDGILKTRYGKLAKSRMEVDRKGNMKKKKRKSKDKGAGSVNPIEMLRKKLLGK